MLKWAFVLPLPVSQLDNIGTAKYPLWSSVKDIVDLHVTVRVHRGPSMSPIQKLIQITPHNGFFCSENHNNEVPQ